MPPRHRTAGRVGRLPGRRSEDIRRATQDEAKIVTSGPVRAPERAELPVGEYGYDPMARAEVRVVLSDANRANDAGVRLPAAKHLGVDPVDEGPDPGPSSTASGIECRSIGRNSAALVAYV